MSAESDPVLDRYARIARSVIAGDTGQCAESSGPAGSSYYDVADDGLDDVPIAAVRSSLGCGNPTAVADLRDGDVVLDLGSGGGLDVLLSARRVGPRGFVYGLDATDDMIDLARRNAAEAGAPNVEFLHGDITAIPLADASVDVVISNCVIVLSSDKRRVFGEIARVLRAGGRLGISDIVRADPADNSPSVVDCGVTATTVERYADDLRGAGLAEVSIALTDPLGGGLSSAIVRAIKPVGTPPAEPSRRRPAFPTCTPLVHLPFNQAHLTRHLRFLRCG